MLAGLGEVRIEIVVVLLLSREEILLVVLPLSELFELLDFFRLEFVVARSLALFLFEKNCEMLMLLVLQIRQHLHVNSSVSRVAACLKRCARTRSTSFVYGPVAKPACAKAGAFAGCKLSRT